MAHVTFVESPLLSSVNSAMLWASNGLMKSSLITTFEGGDDSMISMRPLPTPWFPSHSYTAPLPLAAPLNVLFIAGSIFSQGDQAPQLCKSLMSGKIFSGGALMLVARWTRKVSGVVAAKMRIAASRTTTTIAIILNIDSSGTVLKSQGDGYRKASLPLALLHLGKLGRDLLDIGREVR